MREMASERKGKCLSKKYTNAMTKLKWQCQKGHIWEATPYSIKSRKSWCPVCAISKNAESRKFTIQDMRDIAEKRGGRCLSKKYVSNIANLKWRCSNGHIWEAVPKVIKRGGWCPMCLPYISEKIVENISGSMPSIIPLIMPVEWRSVRAMLLDAVRKEKPDIIIGLGHDESAEALRLEPVLLNRSAYKDEAGEFPPTPYIVEGELEWRTVDLPFKQLAKHLNENGVPAVINEDSSSMTFLCGYAAYLSRHYADKYCDKNAITIFIYLPPPHKVDFDTTVKGIKLVIDFLADLKSGVALN